MDCGLRILDCGLGRPGRLRRRVRRGGFSDTEVLFAVMIQGVGFIMVAAIYPVAIKQAKTST